MLSQEEIDALLNGEHEKTINESPLPDQPLINQYLTAIEQDALGEVGNISFGSSATTLSTLLNQKVEITTPTVSVVKDENLDSEFPNPHVAIRVNYTEGFTGVNLFVIKVSDAAIIADLMLGGDGKSPEEELNDIHLSAVQEAMNQMMGTAATSMSSIFDKRVDISPPSINMLDMNEGQGTEYIPNEEHFIKVSFRLLVGELIDSNIMQLLPVDFAKQFVEELLNGNSSSDQVSPETNQSTPVPEPTQTIERNIETEPSMNQLNEMMNENPYYNNYIGGHTQQAPARDVQSAAFSEFDQQSLEPREQQNLDMLMDIPLKVSVELGRTKKTIKEILEMGSGSIVELDKLAGEPVDIQVNNKLIAKGEVVVIDENFGVRVTDILSQSERIQKLR
ncbi:flagellar motor switch phosphatase FliY [Salinibacillus xinjiangensis]|uniref:Flagellar motor switch phosphatase FliY n=1 Tax=Salinibacillus xinjiangensis TaxID=1229268 RepID=A0A6G1X3B8_9BACI|nr:flagellar motor switch phosphatase FliY [Salinibacillus xinjiangensis]MRG85390.1 flagellar motor switch phosphatase FliY [Salinibacillus xinjiangensis]